MPDTPTSRLALYKSASDGSELVNYSQDIGQNWDKVDLAVGALACTSSTRPSAPWNGQLIRETDTSRVWVSNGSSPASGSWKEIATPGSAQTFTAGLAASGASSTATVATMLVTGDANSRLAVRADGRLSWGPGNAGADTNLYRSAANTLATDDALSVAGNLTVSGTINLASAFADDPTTQTTSSATFVALGSLSASVVVPPSGKVWVTIRVTQRIASPGTGNAITSWIATGSVSGALRADDTTAGLTTSGNSNLPVALTHLVTGGTPGETLTVVQHHRVNGGTNTFTADYRSIALQACPA